MGCTLADYYNSHPNIRKNIRKKFNDMCENNDDSLVLNKQYDKELSVNEGRVRKVRVTEQHTKTLNIEDPVILPYVPNHYFFTNKEKTDISDFNIKFGNLPEFTLFELTQAKYIHYIDKYNSKGGSKDEEKKGIFLCSIKLLGQMIPVQNDTSLDKLTKSTSITEPKMMSNPQYIDGVFQKMVKSNRVHFKTVFDDSSDLDFYDFGIQVVQLNDHKDTSKGRWERKIMPSKVVTFANASLRNLVESCSPESKLPVLFYRNPVTDPYHIHNLGKNKHPIVNFTKLHLKTLKDCGIITNNKEGDYLTKIETDVNSLELNKGDIDCINSISNVLVKVLHLSEDDYKRNVDSGIAIGLNGPAFKREMPSYVCINLKPTLTHGRVGFKRKGIKQNNPNNSNPKKNKKKENKSKVEVDIIEKNKKDNKRMMNEYDENDDNLEIVNEDDKDDDSNDNDNNEKEKNNKDDDNEDDEDSDDDNNDDMDD